MTRLLLMSDVHLGASNAHRADALSDHEAALQEILDLARDRNADLVLNGGDTFHRPPASIPALHVWGRFTRRLEEAGIPIVSVLGNSHDLPNSDAETAVELAQSELARVSRHPEIITFPGVAVCTLPSVPMGRLIAASDGGDRGRIYEQAAEHLVQVARGLHSAAPGVPTVLLAHWMTDATQPAGIPGAPNEPVLPLAELERIGYDVIALGHVHDARRLSDVAVSIGTPIVIGFGEEYVPHGVWIVDLDDDGVTRWELVPLWDRRFVTVDVDLTADGVGDPTDAIAAALDLPLNDAVVRVRWRATEDQHRRVDVAALRSLIADAGGRPYRVAPSEIVKAGRARAEHVDEGLAPLQAVEAWSDANALEPEERAALADLTAELLAEAR